MTNPARRRVRGRLRDAWPPSAGAAPQRHRARRTGRRAAAAGHDAACPTRRGDRPPAPGDRPLARAARAGRPAGRRTACRGGCGCCRRSRPAGTCRRSWPGCASSTAGPRCMVRGQGTEFDSLREYVVGDDVRSIDWRATARRGRRRGAHLAAGAGPPGAAACSTPAAPSAGPGRRRAPAGRGDGRRAAAGRAGVPGRRPGRPARLRPARAGPGRGRRRAPSCCRRWCRRWRRWSRRWSRPTTPGMVATDARPARRGAAWSCCSPRWTRRRSRRACCRCWRRCCAGTRS